MTLTEEHIDYIIKDVRYRGIVYNELDEWGQTFGVRNRSLSVKLNYLFAF